MIRTGTARRSSGSAFSSRRYAGFGNRLREASDGIGMCRRTRQSGARHKWPPFGISPVTLETEGCAASLSESLPDWNRWPPICQSPKSRIVKNCYSTQFCHHNWCRLASGCGKRAFNNVRQVARQSRNGFNAVESCFCLGAAAFFERAPGTEGGRQPCGQLRVFLIQGEHGIGNKIIAGAIDTIELGGIAAVNAVRPVPVGVDSEEAGSPVGLRTLFERIGAQGGGMEGEPFVDHERIGGIARV